MAHGKNAAKKGHPGREYWASRLYKHGECPGRITKALTHRKERRVSERRLKKELNGNS